MKSQPLELQHKEILAARFKALSLEISEYTFANLYLFRKTHAFEIVFDFEIFVKGRTRDGFNYLMPTLPLDQIDLKKLKELLKEVDFLYPVQENFLSYFGLQKTLEGSFETINASQGFKVSFNEADSDYVYEISKFKTYPGRHLAGRRNLVKQFVQNHEVVSCPLTPDLINDAKQVLDSWQESFLKRKGQEIESDTNDIASDYSPCLEALSLMETLCLKGRIFYEGKVPIGFILGETLNQEMFVEHFAKASVLHTGVYQYMYQEFAIDLDDHFYYVNMEQDLGDPGLMRSKKAYMPERLVNKYRISLT